MAATRRIVRWDKLPKIARTGGFGQLRHPKQALPGRVQSETAVAKIKNGNLRQHQIGSLLRLIATSLPFPQNPPPAQTPLAMAASLCGSCPVLQPWEAEFSHPQPLNMKPSLPCSPLSCHHILPSREIIRSRQGK